MELCKIKGHKWFYTDEYADLEESHVQSDKICENCGNIEKAWSGPTKKEIEEATGEEVPSKEEVYNNLPKEVKAVIDN